MYSTTLAATCMAVTVTHILHRGRSPATQILHLRLPPAYIYQYRYHQLHHRCTMASLPPTPSTLAPAQRSEWRFCPVTAPTEWVEDYRPGKFHPIHFGDRVKNGRYRILRKLGYGAYSTVWLARDEQYDLAFIADPNSSSIPCYR